MRRIEERTTIIINIVLMFATIIGSIFLQQAESKINTYNNEKIKLEIIRSEYLQKASYHSQAIHFYELTGILSELAEPLGKKSFWRDDPVAKAENVDGDQKIIMNKYKNGEITTYQFSTEMGNYNREKTEYYKLRIRQVGDEIKRLIKNPPKQFNINVFLFSNLCFIIQFVCVCLAIIFSFELLRKISKRIVS